MGQEDTKATYKPFWCDRQTSERATSHTWVCSWRVSEGDSEEHACSSPDGPRTSVWSLSGDGEGVPPFPWQPLSLWFTELTHVQPFRPRTPSQHPGGKNPSTEAVGKHSSVTFPSLSAQLVWESGVVGQEAPRLETFS